MLTITRPVARATVGLLSGPRTRLRQWNLAFIVDSPALSPDTMGPLGLLLDKAVAHLVSDVAGAAPAALSAALAAACEIVKIGLAASWVAALTTVEQHLLASARWGWLESSLLSADVDFSGLTSSDGLYAPMSRWAAVLAPEGWHSGVLMAYRADQSFSADSAATEAGEPRDPIDELVVLLDALSRYRTDPALKLPCEALAAAGVGRGVAHQLAGATQRITIGALDLLAFDLPRFDIAIGSPLRPGLRQAASMLMGQAVLGQPKPYFDAAVDFASALADTVLREAETLTLLQLFTTPRDSNKEKAATTAITASQAQMRKLCDQLEIAYNNTTTALWVAEYCLDRVRDESKKADGVIGMQATFLDPHQDWYKIAAINKAVHEHVPDLQPGSALFFMTLLIWQRYGYPQMKLDTIPTPGPLAAYKLKMQSLVQPARDAFLGQQHQAFQDKIAKYGFQHEEAILLGQDLADHQGLHDKLESAGGVLTNKSEM